MSLELSLDSQIDPFAKRYEECSKCGGRLALRVETQPNGQQNTSQVCRKCSHQVLTTKINVIKIPPTPGTRR